MSNVDNRIVQMEFDNKQFESGVKETMSTLDRLKQALKLDNVTDGFDKLGKSSDELSSRMKKTGDDGANAFTMLSSQLDAIGGKVDSLVSRFSVLGTMMHNFGMQFASTVKEMSVGQVSAGFTKYAESSEAISTLKSALGYGSKNAIYKAVQELNTYSDQTSYDLSSMTQNLSMFVNSGVKLETATEAIKGIGNAAANAGVSIQKTKNVMKNFSDALGAGALKLQDWKSLELMGFATKEIKEQFIEAGKELKKIDKDGYVLNEKGKKTKLQITYENFRESLKYDWLTAEVMMKTLGKYADTTQEFGANAFEAAKVARTYQEAMDAVRDAVSTGWMHMFENIFGDVDEAASLWTSFSDMLIVRLSDPFFGWINGILKEWKNYGGREKLIRMFSEMSAMLIGLETEVGESVYVNQNLLTSTVEAMQEVFGVLDWRKLLIGTDKVMMAMVNLHKWMDTKNKDGLTIFDRIRSGLVGVFSVFGIFGEIGKGIWSFGKSIAGQLVPSLEALLDLFPEVGEFLKGVFDWFKNNQLFQKFGEKLANIFTPFTSRLPRLITGVYDKLKGFVTFLGTNETIRKAAESWKTFFSTFLDGIPKFIEKAISFGKSLFETFKTTDEFRKIADIYTKYVKPIGKGFIEFGGRVADALTSFFTIDTSGATNMWEKLKIRFGAFGDLGEWVSQKWGKVKELFPTLVKVEEFWNNSKIPDKITKAYNFIDRVFSSVFGLDTSGITTMAGKVKARLKAGYDIVKPAVEKLYNKLKTFVKKHDFLNTIFSSVKTVGSKVKTFLSPVYTKITEWFGKAKDKIKSVFESDNPLESFFEAVKTFGTKAKARLTSFFEPISDAFTKLKDKIKTAFESDNPLEKIGEVFTSIGTKIKNAIKELIFGKEGEQKENFLTRTVSAIVTGWNTAKEKLSSAWETFSAWVGPFWESAKSYVSNLFSSGGEEASADGSIGFFEGIAQKLTSAWESIKGVGEEVWNFFKKLFGKDAPKPDKKNTVSDIFNSTLKESVENGEFDKTLSLFDKLKKYYEDLKKKLIELWDSLKEVDWGSMALKIGGILIVVGIVAGALTAFNFSRAKKLNADGYESTSTKILKIAIAIGLIAGAFYAIGTLEKPQIDNAKSVLVAIGRTIAKLMVLSAIMAKLGGTGRAMKNVGDSIFAIAGSIALIGAAIYILGSLYDTGVFWRGAGIVAGIAVFLLGVQWLSGLIQKWVGPPAKMEGLIGFAGAIFILGLAVIALGLLSKEHGPELWTGVGMVAVLGVILVAFQGLMALIGKFIGQPAKVSGAIASAGAILMLALAVALLSLVDQSKLWSSVGAVAVLALCVIGMQAAMALMSHFKVKAGVIIATIVCAVLLGGLMITLAHCFNQVKDIPTEVMMQFAISFAIIAGTLAAALLLFCAIPFTAALSAAGSLIVFIAAIALAFLLASAIATVGMNNVNTMIFTLGSTLGTFSELTADGSVENAKNMVKDIAGMMGDIMIVAAHASSIELFMTGVTRIGNGLKSFNTATAAIDPSRADNALHMANKIGEVVTALKSSGAEDFPDMAVGLTHLGSALSLYYSSISGIEVPENATFNPENLKTALSGIAEALPSDDMLGAFRDIASTEEGSKGDELAKFALGMEAIKNALWDYANACTDLPINEVTAANTALSQIATLTADIPATSISFEFLGFDATLKTNQPTLEEFASDVTALSTGLDNFVLATEGIDTTKLKSAVDTLTAISEIQPPKQGGIMDFLTGQGTLASFATQMGYLADGFAKYAEKAGAEGIDYSKITNSRKVIEELAAIQNSLDPDGGLMGFIGGTKKEAFAGLADNLGSIGEGVAAFGKAINGGGVSFDNSGDAVSVIKQFAEVYRNMPNIGGFFAAFSGDIHLEDFATKIPELAKGIVAFATGLGDVEIDSERMKAAVNYINDFARIQAKIKTPGDMDLAGFTQQIQSSISALKTTSKDTLGDNFKFNDTAIQQVIGYIRSFKDIAIQMKGLKDEGNMDFETFGKNIKSFFTSLMEVSTDTGAFGSKTFNTEKFKALADGIKTSFDSIKEAIKSIKDINTGEGSLSSIIAGLLDDGVTAIEGKQDAFEGAATKLVEGLQNGIKNGSIDDQASELGSKGAAALQSGSIYSQFVSAGKHLVAGLAEGLSSYGPAVSAAETMAAKVLSAMRNKMSIASPSKATMEYGMYLDEGLALGIDKYGQMANTAAGNVARMVLGTMDSIIQNHDTDVAIKPVLDTTNMASYANTFAAYRNEWSAVDAVRKRLEAAKVSDVAAKMDVSVNDRYANTIESFRSDISDLGDRISSMRVVMDTGTVVGELAPGMDSALGRRANYSSRRVS